MATDFKSRALELATCGICLELFTEPKCLPCLHTFCQHCLDSCFADSAPGTVETCPLCREEFGIPVTWHDGLVYFNFFLRDILILWRSSADHCSKHPLLGATTCDRHGDTPETTVYCFDCMTNVCQLCSVAEHCGHNRKEMREAVDELTSRIDVDTHRLLDLAAVARKQLKELDVSRQNFVTYMKVETTEVTKMCEELNLTDDKTRSFLDEMQQLTSKNDEEMRCSRECLEMTLLEMFVFCAHCSELKAEGKPANITRAAGILHRRATELLLTDVAAFRCSPPVVVFQPPTAAGQDHVTAEGRHSKLGQLRIFKFTDPRVVHTLPEAETVCGVTSLDDEIFVARLKDTEQVDVYDATTFNLVRRINVDGLIGSDMENMTSCGHHRCLYISDSTNGFVYRIDLLQNRCGVTNWSVGEKAHGLSVTDQFSLIVTCRCARKIFEFSTDGKRLREFNLNPDIINPWHAIQLSDGRLVVCHGYHVSPSLYRVCIVDPHGNITHSFGSHRGRATSAMLMWPCHMAVDEDGFVYLADGENRRVLLLSSTLNYIRDVVSRDVLEWDTMRLHLDVERRRIYVADDEGDASGQWQHGRVVVCSLQDSTS